MSLELGLVFHVWALWREVRVVKVFKRPWATQTYPKFMGVPPGGWGGGGCDALPLTRSNIKNLYPFKIRVKAKGEESNSREEGSGKLVSYPS